MDENEFRLAILTALIGSIPPTLAGITTIIVALKTNHNLRGIHRQINSRMDQLLETTKTIGRTEGRDAERDRQK